MSSNLPGTPPKKSFLSATPKPEPRPASAVPAIPALPVPSAPAASRHHCPHCQIKPISPIKKLLFGPVFKFRCSGCGGLWRVSWWSVGTVLLTIVCIPVLIGLAWGTGLMRPSENSLLVIGSVALGFAALVIAYAVPVRKAG